MNSIALILLDICACLHLKVKRRSVRLWQRGHIFSIQDPSTYYFYKIKSTFTKQQVIFTLRQRETVTCYNRGQCHLTENHETFNFHFSFSLVILYHFHAGEICRFHYSKFKKKIFTARCCYIFLGFVQYIVKQYCIREFLAFGVKIECSFIFEPL